MSAVAPTREIGASRAVAASMTISTLLLAAIGVVVGAHPSIGAILAIPSDPVVAMVALAYYVYFRLIASAGRLSPASTTASNRSSAA